METIRGRLGRYELRGSTVGSGYVIVRKDSDHRRTIAMIETIAQWETFRRAYRAGYDEVACVRAIDNESE